MCIRDSRISGARTCEVSADCFRWRVRCRTSRSASHAQLLQSAHAFAVRIPGNVAGGSPGCSLPIWKFGLFEQVCDSVANGKDCSMGRRDLCSQIKRNCAVVPGVIMVRGKAMWEFAVNAALFPLNCPHQTRPRSMHSCSLNPPLHECDA